jgi:hypothetical protein
MSDPNKTGKTKDISSIVNSAVMAVDAVMRKNDVPFANNHIKLRALLMPIIASAVADDMAERALAELDRVLVAVG